ncbi:DUF3313 family protein [Singulisphaera sp. PoT]|uniref:DUF3313 family protein n=1 Tax=Singulisphaera sp. PoT TaxID=3411797 RepID=UPI003BF58342
MSLSPTLATRARTSMSLASRILAMLLASLALASSGCSALSHYNPTQSGLLTDYSGMSKDRFHVNYGLGIQRNYSRNATCEEVGEVDSFYIESITWVVDAESRAGRDPTRRVVLTEALDAAFRQQLGMLRPVVDQPGPHSARVRAVITDARLSRPFTNAALTAAGIAFPFVPIGPTFFGGACVEAEVLTPDSRQIAAISCASGGGPLDVVGYYTRSGHAKKAMRRAARELRQALTP